MSFYHAKFGFMNVGIVSARNRAEARRAAAKDWGGGSEPIQRCECDCQRGGPNAQDAIGDAQPAQGATDNTPGGLSAEVGPNPSAGGSS